MKYSLRLRKNLTNKDNCAGELLPDAFTQSKIVGVMVNHLPLIDRYILTLVSLQQIRMHRPVGCLLTQHRRPVGINREDRYALLDDFCKHILHRA